MAAEKQLTQAASMNSKLLLTNCITLLYRESLIKDSSTSNDLVKTVLDGLKVPSIVMGINKDRDVIQALKDTALEMAANPPDHEYEKDDLLQRIKINALEDNELYKIIEQGIEKDLSVPSLKRSVLNLRKSLHLHFRDEKVAEVLSKSYSIFNYNREKIKDTPTFIAGIISELEPLQSNLELKDPSIVAEIDISDETTTREVFEGIKTMNNGVGVLKTGWQALNIALQGGLKKGECYVIGALQHNYKTGFCISLLDQVARHNVPVLKDPTKKPLLVRLSFEDDIQLDLNNMYQDILASKYGFIRTKYETGGAPEIRRPTGNETVEEMTMYVRNELQSKGYHIKVMRVNPSGWGYKEVFDKILQYEAEGYEVHLVEIDYADMMQKTGCTSSTIGSDTQDLIRRLRNFFSAKNITFITPHQLNSAAKQLKKEGIDDFLGSVCSKGYHKGCTTIDQEIDVEMYVDKVKNKGLWYLDVMVGKHRGVPVIDETLKRFYLPFPKVGPIPDDLERECIAYRKLGGRSIGEESRSKLESPNNDYDF